MLTWREFRNEDLLPCLATMPLPWRGFDIVGQEKAIQAWKLLTASPACRSRVFERDNPRRIVGFGVSAFVTPEFMEEELRNPQFALQSRFIAKLSRDEPTLLSRDGIARANAGGGLNLVFLAGPTWPTATPEETVELQMAATGSCVEAHAGFKVYRVLGGGPVSRIESMKEWHVLIVDRTIDLMQVTATKEDVAANATSLLNLLFRYTPPVLRLRPKDQELLLAALNGATDRELAVALGVSLPAVKQRWQTAFMRVEENRPELFPDGPAADDGARGPQRRHLVLAYIREHPEELRPYFWG